jgi:D-alanyl-D-alanine carboxypeptidase (penicillin-binding protein 5/6)
MRSAAMTRLFAIIVCFAPLLVAQPPDKSPADRLDGPPIVSAKSWAITDGKTGTLLWGSNEAAARPMASTTKIMTAWLVLRLADEHAGLLDETIVYSERAAGTTGSSARLRAGERVNVRDLLFGLLLPSGNDAAVALAEHFGPRFSTDRPALESFVAEMNNRARALKLAETSYTDPNGLSPKDLSSARDLATLTFHAMQNKRFRDIVQTRRHLCDVVDLNGDKRTAAWTNTNKLLDIEGFEGVKTGTTTPAGNCLVASGRRDGDHLIVVVLGATSSDGKFVDARNLFRWGWSQRERATRPHLK